MAELKYWIWMNELGINPYIAHRVVQQLGGIREAYFADRAKLSQISHISDKEIDALMKKEIGRVYEIQDNMNAMNGRILTYQDAEYPQRLRAIDDAPLVLYVRGRLPVVDDEATICVAGTRKCSVYGKRAAARIAGEIVRHGGVIVSGLAMGIDAAAAEGALKEGGPVIGVLGCGLDRVYPPQHAWLFEQVLDNGAIVSEYPPGSEPMGWHFPRRNRIMTGLSLALVVAEMPTEKSGTMRSVNHAVEQGRDIYVIPANIDTPTSRASNNLIDDGFQSASTGWRVLRDYADRFPRLKPPEKLNTPYDTPFLDKKTEGVVKKDRSFTKKVIDKAEEPSYIDVKEALEGLSAQELAVIAVLGKEPIHIDDIIAGCSLPAKTVNAALTTLGISGFIQLHPGRRYSLNTKRIRSPY